MKVQSRQLSRRVITIHFVIPAKIQWVGKFVELWVVKMKHIESGKFQT